MSYYNNRSSSGNSNQVRDQKGSPQQQPLNVKKTRNVSSSASSNMAPATPRMMRLASNPQNISDEYTINTNFQSGPMQQSSPNNTPDLLPGVEFGSSSQQQHHQRPQHYYHYQQPPAPQQQQQSIPPMPSTPKRSSQQPSSSNHGAPNAATAAAAAFHRKSIGDWEFMKTIGSGSMGKVKLAKHRITSEVCAVKVVTRAAKVWQRQHQNDPPPADQHEVVTRKKEFEKELGRDKRTVREAALGKILYHPFICRLYEMYPMSNHYYMLFEYVQGGQMLDYIVSHGSLKESQARKFCRGIASALDYCHSNNIVHRDLKIENIMINTQGEIKIIDFGLSNLFDRENLLKTYCGSLYFAAPELLSAQPYVGPEVDIWSFGVVLYVLTCGKVPFDDKSVNTLHEKIKKGNVEYPPTLSPECVSLLRRMILVNSNSRATIREVINHPWMNKGYQGIVSNYLPMRYPLDLPLNQEIIKTIVDLDLAPSIESVNLELTKIIKSQSYQLSVSNWYAKKNRQPYDLKLPDPTKGIHPILSIYYLVDEMFNRKQAKQDSIEKQQQLQKEQQQIQKHQYVTPQLQQSSIFSATSPQPSVPHESSNRIVTQPVPIQYQHNNSDNNSDPFADQLSPVVNLKPPQAAHTSPHQSSATPHTFNKPSLIIETDDNKSNIQPSQQSPVEQSFGTSILRKLSIKKDSNDVRRVGSVKVTSKEKQQHSTPITKNYQHQQQQQVLNHSQPAHRHQRAASAYTASTFATDKLPPIPTTFDKSNYNNDGDDDTHSQPARYHPNARAKSVGHARKQSLNLPTKASYQNNNNAPPLPQMNITSQQMNHSATGGNEFFDEEDDVNQNAYFNAQNVFKQTRKLNEKEIIEQYQRASPGSMPSIEYPKTLFLKGFFSVQTTSTKPLPVIRYGIISVLPQLGVQFVEVKGGFICVHYPSIVDSSSPIKEESSGLGSPIKTVKYHTPTDDMATEDEGEDNENGDVDEYDDNEADQTTELEHFKSIDSSTSNQNEVANIPTLLSTPQKGHRRKFSLGNSISGVTGSVNSRKGNDKLTLSTQFNQTHSPDSHIPTTPAPANLTIRGASDDSSESLTYDEPIGASDMLISSRVEQQQRTNNVSSKSVKTPLKFEIHIVKVPLVGLYGIQFKKVSGNTWLYKSLASEILSRLNL